MKPILFSTPMVQAIMGGIKTQTRRIIKSNHESGNFQVAKDGFGKITEITSIDWDERPKKELKKDHWSHCADDAVDSFRTLWDSINGKKEGFTWNDNPWVFVYDFKIIDKPKNFQL